MSRLRTHHLHVTEPGGRYWQRMIDFRDHLRRHPDEAAAYGDLKRELALRHERDCRSYTAGKHQFVTAIERRGRGSRAGGVPRLARRCRRSGGTRSHVPRARRPVRASRARGM